MHSNLAGASDRSLTQKQVFWLRPGRLPRQYLLPVSSKQRPLNSMEQILKAGFPIYYTCTSPTHMETLPYNCDRDLRPNLRFTGDNGPLVEWRGGRSGWGRWLPGIGPFKSLSEPRQLFYPCHVSAFRTEMKTENYKYNTQTQFAVSIHIFKLLIFHLEI